MADQVGRLLDLYQTAPLFVRFATLPVPGRIVNIVATRGLVPPPPRERAMWAWVMGEEGGNVRPHRLSPQRHPYRGAPLASPRRGTQKVSFSRTAAAIDCYCHYPPPPPFAKAAALHRHPLPPYPPPTALSLSSPPPSLLRRRLQHCLRRRHHRRSCRRKLLLCRHFHRLKWPGDNGGE